MADVDYGLPAIRIAKTHFRDPQCAGYVCPGVGLLHILHRTPTQGAEEAARQLYAASAAIAEPLVGGKGVQSIAALVDAHITAVTEDYLVSELPFRLNILNMRLFRLPTISEPLTILQISQSASSSAWSPLAPMLSRRSRFSCIV